MRINKDRRVCELEKGDIVFKKLPKGARLPKHTFPPPSTGPYKVESQPTSTSVRLRDANTGALVDKGAYIPLDQILAGPARANLKFEEDSEVRGIAQMLAGGQKPTTEQSNRTSGFGSVAPGAYVAYQTIDTGPKAKELTIGKVLVNNRVEQTMSVQPCAGVSGLRSASLISRSMSLGRGTRIRRGRRWRRPWCVTKPSC